MATAKKQKKGVQPPATAGKRPARKKDTPQRKAKQIAWRVNQKEALEEVREERAEKERVPHFNEFVWTPELVQIFEDKVSAGEFIEHMAHKDGLPGATTMWKAIGNEQHLVAKAYARGKMCIVAKYEEDIAIEALNERRTKIRVTKIGVDGSSIETRVVDNTERSKIKIDALKWQLAHLRPKKHGRNADAGDAGKPNEQLEALFQALQAGPVDG